MFMVSSTVKVWLGVLVGLLLLTACTEAERPLDSLVVGQPFPEISLQQLNGGTASLADYRGKLVVLNVWGTWCEPCRREMPNLQALSEALDPARFAVIALAEDDDAHIVREYLLEKNIRFPSYIDPGRVIATDTLGIQIFPYTLLIAPDGHFIQRVPGPREWHRDEVVALLEQAFLGDYSGL